MKNLTSVLNLFFIPIIFILLSVTVNANNNCPANQTTNYTFTASGTGATYIGSGTLNSNNNKNNLYYFQVPSAGTLTFTDISSDADIRYIYDKLICPGSAGGTSLPNMDNTIIFTDSDLDFNLRVRNSGSTNNQDFEFSFVFKPDASSAPDVTPATFSINEDASDGATVGTVQTTGGTPTSFTIVSGNADGIFTIDNSGVITIANNTNLDFESTTSYTLSVRADNATGNGTPGDITIGVNDVDETPPNVTPVTFSVDEDASNGSTVGTVSTTGTTPTSFTIVSGNGDGIFQIDNSGVITIADNTNLDYETITSYSLSIQASNSYGTGTADTITINVNDVDESGGGGGTEPSECPTGANESFRDFCLRKKITLPGNMVTIGNTVLVAPETQNDTVCDTYKNGAYTSDATSANDSYYLCQYWDDATRPSTSATIDTSNIPDPSNSTLEWAGLYWQALVDDSVNVTGMKIKIKNGTDNYVEVGYDKLDWGDGVGHAGEISYSAFKDVTDILNTNSWLDGKYTVADIPVKEGKIDNLGTYGAWTLVLVYRNDGEKLRNFSIFDGWKRVQDSAGNREVSINISGFYTPKQSPISSSASVFTAEGDKHISGDYLYATNANNGDAYEILSHTTGHTFNSAIVPNDFTRTPDPVNNQGIDIQTFQLGTDGEDFLETTQSSIDFKFTTNQDTYFPSMIAFNTELYAPELCYDYAYKQFDQYFTEDNNGSYSPTIIGEGLSTSEPVIVELFIRNDETSDATATNVVFHVTDINSSQAIYMPNSAYVTHPNNIYSDIATPNPLQEININDIAGNEYFSVDYNLSLVGSSINMPIKAWLEYTLILSDSSGNPIPLDFVTVLNENIPLCTSANFAYYPEYAIFNVENSVLSASQEYNLPTQTANRVGDFKVTAYNQVPNENSRKNVTTIVSVELIDANKYHDIKASCVEPDSALTPRVWVVFENNSSTTDFDKTTIDTAITKGMVSDSIVDTGITPIAEAEDYFSFAKENAAFRISYNTLGDDDALDQLELSDTCNNNQVPPCYIWKDKSFTDIAKLDVGNGPGVCAQDMANGQDTIPQWCGNNGTKGLDAPHLAECMECLYGVGIKYICSRDNFAIRPENFRVTLNDQEQNGTNKSFIAYNDDPTKLHSSDNGDRIVADYNYAVEINATNHQNDNTTPGYYASFNEDGDGGMRTFQLKWSTFTDDTTYCNDTSDHNKSTTFHNGYTDLNLSNSEIGKYELNLFDKLWTRVDWDSNYLSHHLTNTAYFTSGSDCRDGDSIVPVQSSITATYLEDMSGCDINTSSHTNSDNNLEYTDIPLYIFPYKFDHVGVIPAAGPSGKNFVYINTPDVNDKNMSYNMNGTFSAVGFDNGRLSNFVDQCYADDVNMTLYLQYQHAQPTDSEPFLSYDLIDINSIDSSIIRARPTAVPGEPTYRFSTMGPLSITQDEQYFVKDMNGSITMDLGYNFKRNYNEPMNPRFIQMNDFNITYLSNPADVKADLESDFQIFGNKDLNDNNISFIYGRAKPGKFFYEDIVDPSVFTPVSAIAYCDLGFTVCQDRGIMAAFAKTNEADWWLSIDHRTADNDGDIILVTGTPTEGSGSPTVTPTVTITTSDATDNTVQVVSNATELPMTVPINFVTDTTLASFTDDWLIYNEYDNNVTNPFYKVRFIGDSNWTGIGDEGMVVGTEASKRKTKRLDW